jgi:glycerophosphoryl diester phosphodiesterase
MKKLLPLLLVGTMQGEILKIAHRGASGHAPENSAEAFKKAIELGADMIEFDVHVCRSGQLVVIHDKTVNRTTHGQGHVEDFDLVDLQKLLLRRNKNLTPKILTLQEALELIDRRALVDIELKGPNTAAATAKVIYEFIKKGWQFSDFYVSSFDHYQLQEFKELCPEVNIMPLLFGIPLGYAESVKSLNAQYIVVCHDYLSEPFVADIKSRGMKLFVYTPNSEREIERAKQFGVDGIISDYPDRI